MSDESSRVAQALMEAIKAESDGFSFYKMAAQSSADEKGREIFEQLAAEELDHKRFLSAQYQAVLSTGKPDAALALGRRVNLEGQSPIFSDQIRGRIKEAHLEMSALSIGIQLEAGAMKYYKEQAELAQDDAVKRFFEELAEWERGHYTALLRQQDSLKDDYWQGSGFSPF